MSAYFIAPDEHGQTAIWLDRGARSPVPLMWRPSGTPSQIERRALFDHLAATLPERDATPTTATCDACDHDINPDRPETHACPEWTHDASEELDAEGRRDDAL